MAFVVDDYPLYYDAINEYGLGMAGLNFPNNAHYFPLKENLDNVGPFEFIPWVLTQCKNIADVKKLLETINIANIFLTEYPNICNSPKEHATIAKSKLVPNTSSIEKAIFSL